VSDEVEGTLVRVAPETGTVTKKIRLAGRPEGVTTADGSVWTGVQAAGSAHKGGNLRLQSPVFDYLDPALAYYVGTWDLISVTSDGLVGFKRVGGIDGNTLVADLATSLPRPSDNGRTYSFQLRPGIRFSTGKEVTPADVRATFERIFRAYGFEERLRDEHGKLTKPVRDTSPAVGYYSGIVGAADCQKHATKPCDLSRGIVTSDADNTVTFHLTAADPEFLYKLALPFGSVVPKGTPVGKQQIIPGTGPYKVATFIPYRYARLVRNPLFHVWRADAQPDGLPDTIELRTNVAKPNGRPSTTSEAFRAAAAGRIDVPEGGVPSELMTTARTRYPAQLYTTPAPQTNWIILNTTRPPFSNVHARRALAYALDRGKLVASRGGTDVAATTCQLLPPGMPAYKPYCPFTAPGGPSGRWTAPDLARARAEVARSGTRGARVRMITTDQTPGFGEANLVAAAALRRLGYRVSVKHYALDRDYFGSFFTDSKHIDAAANGWIQDYPAPSNFFTGLNCPASPYTCDPKLRTQFAQTTTEANTSGSNEPWTKLDRDYTDSAIVIPFMSPKSVDFVSKRVGNFQHHPEFDLLIDQLWVR
jgi:peptide/nickel transport system substrate-binding protein